MEYEKYLEEIRKVYRKTESYARSNKKIWGTYLENPTIENRNKILMRNIWMINSAVNFIIRLNPLLYEEDLFGEGVIEFYKLLETSVRRGYDSKEMSIHVYLGIRRKLIERFVKNYQEDILDFYEDMDIFEFKENPEPFWREDFYEDLGIFANRSLSEREFVILTSTIGEPGQYFNGQGCKTIEEISWRVGLSRERVRQLREKSIEKLRDSDLRPIEMIWAMSNKPLIGKKRQERLEKWLHMNRHHLDQYKVDIHKLGEDYVKIDRMRTYLDNI